MEATTGKVERENREAHAPDTDGNSAELRTSSMLIKEYDHTGSVESSVMMCDDATCDTGVDREVLPMLVRRP